MTVFISVTIFQLDADFLHAVVTSCHNLETLDMSGLLCVTDDILVTIAENCRHLTAIGLKGCREVK